MDLTTISPPNSGTKGGSGPNLAGSVFSTEQQHTRKHLLMHHLEIVRFRRNHPKTFSVAIIWVSLGRHRKFGSITTSSIETNTFRLSVSQRIPTNASSLRGCLVSHLSLQTWDTGMQPPTTVHQGVSHTGGPPATSPPLSELGS